MTDPAHPSLRSTPPPSHRLTELRTRLREGGYQVPTHQVADRILTKLTTPEAQDLVSVSGSGRTTRDPHTDPPGSRNRNAESTTRRETTPIPSPTEVRRYQDWVQHQRSLQDAELSEIPGVVLTTEEARYYHQWVQHQRRLEDAAIDQLFDTPGGSGQLE